MSDSSNAQETLGEKTTHKKCRVCWALETAESAFERYRNTSPQCIAVPHRKNGEEFQRLAAYWGGKCTCSEIDNNPTL